MVGCSLDINAQYFGGLVMYNFLLRALVIAVGVVIGNIATKRILEKQGQE
jgi:hypothetical protein